MSSVNGYDDVLDLLSFLVQKVNSPPDPSFIHSPEAQWITREGKTIPISQMSDRHLENAVRFLQRAWISKCLDLYTRHNLIPRRLHRRSGSWTFRPALPSFVSSSGPASINALYDGLLSEIYRRNDVGVTGIDVG